MCSKEEGPSESSKHKANRLAVDGMLSGHECECKCVCVCVCGRKGPALAGGSGQAAL